ncbi:hypothetical protein SHO565_77540 [Streptomyces sp. HO565]
MRDCVIPGLPRTEYRVRRAISKASESPHAGVTPLEPANANWGEEFARLPTDEAHRDGVLG